MNTIDAIYYIFSLFDSLFLSSSSIISSGINYSFSNLLSSCNKGYWILSKDFYSSYSLISSFMISKFRIIINSIKFSNLHLILTVQF